MSKILVVDDEPSNSKLLATMLSYAGYKVMHAQNGQAALEVVQRELPYLVLLDVQMPRLDGLDVLKRLRSDPGTMNLKMVATTGLAMEGEKLNLLRSGFDAYLAKPIRYKELLALVAEMLPVGVA